MGGPPLPPELPLLRLRAAHADRVRPLLERAPALGHAAPAHRSVDGEGGLACYRLSPGAFWVQVRWRLEHGQWLERDAEVVAGSVVALRLVLDDLEPGAVSDLLGLAPTRAFGRRDGAAAGRAGRDEGLWIHEVMTGAFCLPEEKVHELLALLRARVRWREVVGHRGVRWAGVTVKLHTPIEQPPSLALEPRALEDLVGLSLALDVSCAIG